MRYIAFLFVVVTAPMVAQQLPKVEQVSFQKDTFNIVRFGAKADGMKLNTEAINTAITTCHQKGGGVVLVPKGFWLTGPIIFKSNVNLHLAQGSVIQFSDNTDHYPLMKTNWEGLDAIRAQSPIYGVDLENIAITGEGILDGAGQVWRPVKKSKLTSPEWDQLVAAGGFLNEAKDTWYPTERALRGSTKKRAGVVEAGFDINNAEEIKEFLRPNMVNFVRCKKVLLEGITVQNSPAWCLHPMLCQHLTVRNVLVRNPWNAQNGDGIDVESCRFVLIENSVFDVGDDGICIKSGRDEEGRKRGVPTEDVIVRNCTVFHAHGGFVVGSEMSGGARNLFISDCNFLGTDIGIRFKTTRGRGGIVEKVWINNIRMSNIGDAAILFDMYYMAKDPLAVFSEKDSPSIDFQPVNDGTPQFHDIHLKDVVCKGASTGIFIRGLPEMNIKGIDMENITIQSKKGLVCTEGEDIKLKNVNLYCAEATVMTLQNSKNIVLDNIGYKAADVLLSVGGSRSKGIRLLNTDGTKSKQEIKFGQNVSGEVISKK